jgi:hypothetical protein
MIGQFLQKFTVKLIHGLRKKVLLLYSGGSATTTSLHEPLTKAHQIGPIHFLSGRYFSTSGNLAESVTYRPACRLGPLWCQRYVVTRSFEDSRSLTSQNGLVLLLRSSLRCTLWGNLWARSRDYIYLTNKMICFVRPHLPSHHYYKLSN